MTPTYGFAYAFLSGLAVSVLEYGQLHSVPKIRRPATFSDPAYLVKFFGHPFIGGFLGVVGATSIGAFNPAMAAIVGAAAPNILIAMMRAGIPMFHLFLRELGSSDKREQANGVLESTGLGEPEERPRVPPNTSSPEA